MEDGIFLASAKKILLGELPIEGLVGIADKLRLSGQIDYAKQLYNLWIHLNQHAPSLYAAYFNHANLLSSTNDLAGAKSALESAIRLAPDFYGSYINIGGVCERQGDTSQAITYWLALNNKVSAVNSNSIDYKLMALKQIGRVLEGGRQFESSEHFLKDSLEIVPNQHDVTQHFIAMRLAQCKWPVTQPLSKMGRKDLIKGMGPLSMSVYVDDPMLQMACSWHYNKSFLGYPSHDYQERHKALRQNPRQGRRRVGYISSDLRNHAVGYVMAEFFELHARGNCEVFIYYCGSPDSDALQERIKAGVEHWVNIRDMSDEAAAERIMNDGIEILVDVNGYTKEARTKVFALNPAPIQVNWFGYPGTMGSPYHHYIIADDWIIPRDHEQYYSEKVMRLPCYQPNDRKRVVDAKRFTRAELSLPEKGVVFCCFNGSQKITRFTFERWMTILKGVEGSVLWLLATNDSVHQRLWEYAKKCVVEPSRIVFAPPIQNQLHLARYLLADLFLDTSPYGAHVTASDSLWMGVPILTLSGLGFASRVCGSLSRAAGVPEMVCSTPDEYVARAIELGNNPSELKRLKEKLASNRDTCLLFDVAQLITHIEALYGEMWDEFCEGKLPRPDLTNMDVYLDRGCERDPDSVEVLATSDYADFYKTEFLRRHRYSQMVPDQRLWTAADIQKADADPDGQLLTRVRAKNDNSVTLSFDGIKSVFKKLMML